MPGRRRAKRLGPENRALSPLFYCCLLGKQLSGLGFAFWHLTMIVPLEGQYCRGDKVCFFFNLGIVYPISKRSLLKPQEDSYMKNEESRSAE